MDQTDHSYHVFETAGGCCGIAWNGVGITRFQLPTRSAEATAQMMMRRQPGAERAPPPPHLLDVITAVKRYFDGERTDFSSVTIDLAGQDDFHRRIYAVLRHVGWGETTTYGTLAKDLGAGQQAARDVGHAMARNPVPLIIPCHRVLAAGGKVGGFSAPGGATAKLHMLELEGVRLHSARPAQHSLLL